MGNLSFPLSFPLPKGNPDSFSLTGIKRVGRLYLGAGINLSFYLPLNDLGNGAVNTVTLFALGSVTPTITRASVAWCKLASGLWGQVTTGVMRSHYLGRDTAIGPYGGFLSELPGTQLVTPTAAIRDMTNAAWTAIGITPTKTATGIDGVPNSASTLTCTAPNGTILQTLVAAATSRTNSHFVRRVSGSGAILLKQGTATQDITASINSVTYTRLQLNDNELNVAFGLQMATIGDVIEVDFNQFEPLTAGQFASSPMASTGAARAADVFTFAGAGNYNPAQGTVYAEVSTNFTTNGVSAYIVGFPADARFSFNSLSTQNSVGDGTSFVTKTALSDTNGVVRKRIMSFGAAGLAITGDGLTPATGAFDGAMGTGANIHVAHLVGFQQLNGTLKELRIYLAQSTAAQMQTIST